MYLVFTNFLFFIFGCALLSFGMMAIHLKISVAMLIPINILKSMTFTLHFILLFTLYVVISILGIILVFTSLIGLLGSFYRERRSLHILCTTTVIIAFLYQVSIAIMVYNQAAHTTSWLSEAWAESSVDYRLYAQTKVVFFVSFFFSGLLIFLSSFIAVDSLDHLTTQYQVLPVYHIN